MSHPRDAATVAASLLAVGLIVVVLLGTRIRQALHRRRQARAWRRQATSAFPT